MKKILTLALCMILTLSLVLVGCSSDKPKEGSGEKKETSSTEKKDKYQYYTADEVKDIVENKKPAILLDVQVEKEFNEHHIKGAIPTYAYPAKTAEDTAKLDSKVDMLKASKDPIVVVCPGGAGGATRSIDYLVKKGIDEKRFFILKDGQGKWPYDELLEK